MASSISLSCPGVKTLVLQSTHGTPKLSCLRALAWLRHLEALSIISDFGEKQGDSDMEDDADEGEDNDDDDGSDWGDDGHDGGDSSDNDHDDDDEDDDDDDDDESDVESFTDDDDDDDDDEGDDVDEDSEGDGSDSDVDSDVASDLECLVGLRRLTLATANPRPLLPALARCESSQVSVLCSRPGQGKMNAAVGRRQ